MLAGTITGVGMFAIPKAIETSGLLAGFFHLLFLTAVILTVHLAYGDIVLHNGAHKRLMGYAGYYFGTGGRVVALIATVAGLMGALLAYILVGGIFLHNILEFAGITLSIEAARWIFFVLGTIGIASGVRAIGEVELLGSVAIAVMILALFLVSVPYPSRLAPAAHDLAGIAMPYGVILFALGGRAAIEEMRESFVGDPAQYRRAISAGTLIPALLYLLFAIAVLALSPQGVSEEAFQGMRLIVGEKIIVFGAILGIFAVFKAYIAIGLNVMKTLWYDVGMHKSLALASAVGLPAGAYLLGVENYITVVAGAGVVMGGIEGALVLLMHKRLVAVSSAGISPPIRIMPPVRYGIIGIFLLGILYHFYFLLADI